MNDINHPKVKKKSSFEKDQPHRTKALFLEPGKRYSQKVEHPFHISMAALEIPTDHSTLKGKLNEVVGVMVGVDKGEFLLTSLNYRQVYQQPVDLNFTEGEEVTFFLNGEGNVHLTGYVMDDDQGLDGAMFSDEDIGDSDGDMSEEEVPDLVPIKAGKRKKEPKATPTKKMKWIDDEAEETDSDENSDGDMDSDGDIDFDSFYDEDDDEDDEEEEESEDEKPQKKNKSLTKTPKDKQKPQEESKKSAKKNKTKVEVVSTPKTPAGDASEATSESSKKKKKKKKKKNKEEQESTPQVKEQKTPQTKLEQKTPQSKSKPQPVKKQVLAGGTVMEEVHSGEGQAAKSGKMVHVYYVGKLQKNGRQFDSCTKGKPFRFRLGASEVIKGWDSGLVGMKVGGKRRLTVPPQQAYGSQGVGGIPPNSTLVFEVELKNIS